MSTRTSDHHLVKVVHILEVFIDLQQLDILFMYLSRTVYIFFCELNHISYTKRLVLKSVMLHDENYNITNE